MNKLNFKTYPELKTKRLFLRKLKKDDASEIFYLRTNDIVNKYIDRKRPKRIDEANEFIIETLDGIKNNKWIYWAITLKDNPKLIGTICFWNFSNNKKIAEVGFELNPEFHGQGIMNEALISIIEFGFKTIGLDIIAAYIHKDNISSTKLVIKNNFEVDNERKDKENVDVLIFTLKNQTINAG